MQNTIWIFGTYEANEALKELYGDDYEEPGKNPFEQQNTANQNNLTGRVATHFSLFSSRIVVLTSKGKIQC